MCIRDRSCAVDHHLGPETIRRVRQRDRAAFDRIARTEASAEVGGAGLRERLAQRLLRGLDFGDVREVRRKFHPTLSLIHI